MVDMETGATGESKEEKPLLDKIEARIIGALMEKQHTTPDYYPMTLNALCAACNQKSNRDPVLHLAERQVVVGLERLRRKGYSQMVDTVGSRVNKYGQILSDVLKLSQPEIALLCVLLLRGPQTIGEMRGRTGRLHEFTSVDEVEQTLHAMAEREDMPLVTKLPRQVGRKEPRYTHLLCGTPEVSEETQAENGMGARPEAVRLEMEQENQRIAALEQQVQQLHAAVRSLQEEFEGFKKQFE